MLVRTELSREQFMVGAEKLFKQWDKDKKGALDEKMLIDVYRP